MQRLTLLLRELRVSFWIQKWSLIRLLRGLSPVFQQYVLLSSLTETLYSAASLFENTCPKRGTCFIQHGKRPSQCVINSSALLSRTVPPLIFQKSAKNLFSTYQYWYETHIPYTTIWHLLIYGTVVSMHLVFQVHQVASYYNRFISEQQEWLYFNKPQR